MCILTIPLDRSNVPAMARRRTWGRGGVRKEPLGRWAIRWREDGRRRYLGGFDSRNIAERALAVRLGAIAADRSGVQPDPRLFPTLGELAEPWLERRKTSHRSWSDDRSRWKCHLAPFFGRLRAREIDTACIRRFVEAELAAGTNKTTIGLYVRLLSTFFSDLRERPRETGATLNPVAGLPKNLRRLYRSDHDPRFTPYVRRLFDVRRIFRGLPESVSIAYAVGVCAGLRTGEILGLQWEDVEEEVPRISVRRQVQDGRLGPLKDLDARILQGAFLDPLAPILRAWRLRSGGRGLLLQPVSCKRPSAFFTPARLYRPFRAALHILELEQVTWYQATRHTFASHWMRAGHSLGQLAAALGHSATWVTERYAHLEGGETEDPWRMDLAGKKTGSPVRQVRGKT
jgi:integrase